MVIFGLFFSGWHISSRGQGGYQSFCQHPWRWHSPRGQISPLRENKKKKRFVFAPHAAVVEGEEAGKKKKTHNPACLSWMLLAGRTFSGGERRGGGGLAVRTQPRSKQTSGGPGGFLLSCRGCIFSSLSSLGAYKCPPCAFKKPESLLPSPPGIPAGRFPSAEHPCRGHPGAAC